MKMESYEYRGKNGEMPTTIDDSLDLPIKASDKIG
jgi:hypothetical protein